MGLRLTTAATASLLGNFEIVATALVALLAFKEGISPRLWGGILLVRSPALCCRWRMCQACVFRTVRC